MTNLFKRIQETGLFGNRLPQIKRKTEEARNARAALFKTLEHRIANFEALKTREEERKKAEIRQLFEPAKPAWKLVGTAIAAKRQEERICRNIAVGCGVAAGLINSALLLPFSDSLGVPVLLNAGIALFSPIATALIAYYFVKKKGWAHKLAMRPSFQKQAEKVGEMLAEDPSPNMVPRVLSDLFGPEEKWRRVR